MVYPHRTFSVGDSGPALFRVLPDSCSPLPKSEGVLYRRLGVLGDLDSTHPRVDSPSLYPSRVPTVPSESRPSGPGPSENPTEKKINSTNRFRSSPSLSTTPMAPSSQETTPKSLPSAVYGCLVVLSVLPCPGVLCSEDRSLGVRTGVPGDVVDSVPSLCASIGGRGCSRGVPGEGTGVGVGPSCDGLESRGGVGGVDVPPVSSVTPRSPVFCARVLPIPGRVNGTGLYRGSPTEGLPCGNDVRPVDSPSYIEFT